jgi:poly(hydroxyalkanoate) depolymerase family esterase
MHMKLNQDMFAQMRKATKNLLSKGPASATKTIQQVLAGLRGAPAQAAAPVMHDINPPPLAAAAKEAAAKQAAAQEADATSSAAPAANDIAAQVAATVAAAMAMAKSAAANPAPFSERRHDPASAQEQAQDFAQELMAKLGVPGGLAQAFKMPAATPAPEPAAGAQFIAGSYVNHAGSRNYKLYIPSTYHGQAMPLLVMLHGCTQSPDDFAAGTQMNAVAEEMQCFVVYPEQSKSANNTKCWNWFNALDQQRDQGEPSLIAGIAQHIIASYPVDRRRVYVAGLSAGGAMAIIVGTLYPELFAAVGVHSGLPFASAQDLPSALAAMRSGATPGVKAEGGGIPIIVFHGDRDTTVNPRNGEELMAQGLRGHGGKAAPASKVHSDSVPNGYRYTRTTHHHADGSPLGEHWVIHGAGHAWSGGSAHGSYTDGKGPDASREMMRFFKTVR